MSATEALPLIDDALSPDDVIAPASELAEPAMRRQHRAQHRDWLRAGFYSTLGAVLMALLAYAIWRVSDATLSVITPFVVGLVLALLLDPLVDKLERRGLPRLGAVGVVFGGLLVLLIGAAVLLGPVLVDQISQLAQNGPKFLAGIRSYIGDFLKTHHKLAPHLLPKNFEALSAQFSARISSTLQASAGKLTEFLVGSVTVIIEMVLSLIITFFLLVDIDRLRARLFFLAPESWRTRMGQMGKDVGGVFADYLRGLLIVCALYGVTTIVMLYGLSLVHHPLASYALLVGVAAGVLYAVPYVGSLTTALVTFLVAFASASTPHHSGLSFGIVAVLATLVVNQVFDNVVTPHVVGGGVGLHPVMALFALVLGGTMFGIAGMLFSVPVAASIQVILFRLYPKLTAPTPTPFLRAQGVPPDRRESAKTRHGSKSATADNKKQQTGL